MTEPADCDAHARHLRWIADHANDVAGDAMGSATLDAIVWAADEIDRLRAELTADRAAYSALLDEVAAAYEHRLGILRRGHSDYIRENGRKGESPWSELMAALQAVLDARHAGIVRGDGEGEGGRP